MTLTRADKLLMCQLVINLKFQLYICDILYFVVPFYQLLCVFLFNNFV
jgi:hypothetical protein